MSHNPAPQRNAACACGSGLRYKHCHGLIGGPPADPRIERARERLAQGDRAAAERVCGEILVTTPEHPGALQLLALSAYEQRKPVVALELALRAARALRATPLPPAAEYEVWTRLNFMFDHILAGLGTAAVEAKLDAYDRSGEVLADASAVHDRNVSIIMVLPPGSSSDACGATLATLAAQTLPPCEIIVVRMAGATVDPAAALGTSVPMRVVDVAATDFAAALNAGIAASRGHWLLAIDPPHALAPDHLLSLVDALGARNAEWGFSASAFEPFGAVAPERVAARAASGTALQNAIADADTVGFALINSAFVAAGSGACLFSRNLVDRVGAFRDLPGHETWDYALRACWLAEPYYLPTASYRHRVSADAPAPNRDAAGMTQARLFRDYYAIACDVARIPPNPFAPSLASWGLQMLKRVFRCGHVLAFDLPMIEILAAQVIAAVRLPAPSQDERDTGVFVTYAQNGEDAILAHVLAGVERGRYIDVGANDPDAHSVTRAFYDRGWSGVNIEPVPAMHARLAAARTRDVNLAVAAGRQRGDDRARRDRRHWVIDH